MALTKREREFIIEMSRRQDALERFLGTLSGPIGSNLVAIDQLAGEREFLLNRSNTSNNLRVGSAAKKAGRAKRQKIKRTVSPYQKEFGRQLKRLKKKHPRTKISTIMKRSHVATRRKLKVQIPRRK